LEFLEIELEGVERAGIPDENITLRKYDTDKVTSSLKWVEIEVEENLRNRKRETSNENTKISTREILKLSKVRLGKYISL
jgi:hypothetical protein